MSLTVSMISLIFLFVLIIDKGAEGQLAHVVSPLWLHAINEKVGKRHKLRQLVMTSWWLHDDFVMTCDLLLIDLKKKGIEIVKFVSKFLPYVQTLFDKTFNTWLHPLPLFYCKIKYCLILSPDCFYK